MMKKILSIVGCLVPFGAGAVVYPGGLNIGAEDSGVNITSGDSITLTDGGLTVANNLNIGIDATDDADQGELNAQVGIGENFAIVSDGNVSVGTGTVYDGYSLSVQAGEGRVIDVDFGTLNANGAFSIANPVNSFAVTGKLTSLTALNVAAGNINLGQLEVAGGNATLTTDGALTINAGNMLNALYQTSAAGNTTVTAASVDVTAGGIQNNSGSMVFNLGAGTLSTADRIENSASATRMEINAGDVIVNGTMKNDTAGAVLDLDVKNLTVSGGDDDNPSFVSKGTFIAKVDGLTRFENGMKLDDMPATNTFDLETGTLDFGTDGYVDSGILATMFTSNLSGSTQYDNVGYKLVINEGDFAFGDNVSLVNGDRNADANMTIHAKNIQVQDINNFGTMNLNATESNDVAPTIDGSDKSGVFVGGTITGGANSDTTITSSANIVAVAGVDVGAGADMLLNGVNVGLGNIYSRENANSLQVLAAKSGSGKIYIANNIETEGGNVLVSGGEVEIGGVIRSTGGTTTIESVAGQPNNMVLKLGGVDIQGGVVSLNSLVNDVNMTGGLSVTGGALNVSYVNAHNITVGGDIKIYGNLSALNLADAVSSGGNVNIAATGGDFVLSAGANSITIGNEAADGTVTGGNVVADKDDVSRTIVLDAKFMNIKNDAVAANKGTLVFGTAAANADGFPVDATGQAADYQTLDVGGALSATNGGVIEIYAQDTSTGSVNVGSGGKLAAYGSQIVADTGDIEIAGGVLFNNSDADAGLVILNNTNKMNLQTTAPGADIVLAGGLTMGQDANMTIVSADAASVDGNVTSAGNLSVTAVGAATFDNGAIDNSNVLYVSANTVDAQNVTNTGTATFKAIESISLGRVKNSGTLTVDAAKTVTFEAFENATNGQSVITALDSVSVLDSFLISGTGMVTVSTKLLDIAGTTVVAGNINQGNDVGGMLNLTQSGMIFNADSLTVTGKLNAAANSVNYNIQQGVTISGDIDVDSGAGVDLLAGGDISTADIINDGALRLYSAAGAITAGDITSAGDLLQIEANEGITVGDIYANGGALLFDSDVQGIAGRKYTNADSLTLNDATVTLKGMGLRLGGVLSTTGTLYQNATSGLSLNDINVFATEYEIYASNLFVGAVSQESGAMQIYTGDIRIDGGISATDLRFVTSGGTNYLDVIVNGDVSGNVDFIGLEHMIINDGNYTFNNNSAINAVVLAQNASPYKYWATVSLDDKDTLGEITNDAGVDATPLIEVNKGMFINESTVSFNFDKTSTAELGNGQIGVKIFDMVDQGSVIWLLHADNGLNELANKIRNLNVNFCNADGSMCFNYLDSYNAYNGTDQELPIYISVRDTNSDDKADSLYIVFDPRFGGPVEVFKIQPIVELTPSHTVGEYVSAGALDNMVAGQLQNKGFYNRTPIEAIPVVFKGTNLETVANELYDRMEYYVLKRDEDALARFSRLFQVRELEQVMGALSLNEHTNFRSFEDRMFDEFIWNRNRNLKKAWMDVDFGMFVQNVSDDKRVDGNRFNVSGGFDWQESNTLILGVTGRVSHMSSSNSDAMDLSYLANTSVAGNVSMDVADTNIGLGGYLMKTLGNKTRVYGNAFLDLHLFDIERNQTFVDRITGNGTSFALTSEWGLMHDWLNQYIVGNIYARLGYNFGVNITEKAAGDEYMKLESDGYAILTPGYSLTAQKRIYPSAWFQIRPYATIGIEYDVLGAPDYAQYKFAPAHAFTRYDIDIDPMWANIGGGFEFLSATGVQVGVDYRYQYNDAIQLHNIKLSGSYRF